MLGILSSGDEPLSSLVAYNVEKKVLKNPHELGRGAIGGVAAPESANNAGAQTWSIPCSRSGSGPM